MAFGAPGRRISAVVAVIVVVVTVVVLVVVAVVVVEGAAAALGPEVAAPTAAAAALFLAVLLGGPEESEGFPSHRVVAAGGVDLLFRGGIDSVPRELVVAAALQFLLEQRNWRSSPSVSGSSSSETVPKSNSSASQCRGASASYAAIGSYSGVGSRLSGIESREEAERVEEEEEEESSMELEPEEEEIAMATGDCGFFGATWLWEEDEFAVKRADSG